VSSRSSPTISANINTTGYKADSQIFEQFLMPKASAGQFPPGSRQPAFVRDRTTWHDFRLGPDPWHRRSARRRH